MMGHRNNPERTQMVRTMVKAYVNFIQLRKE